MAAQPSIPISTSPPANPSWGDLYFNTRHQQVMVYNGSGWIVANQSGSQPLNRRLKREQDEIGYVMRVTVSISGAVLLVASVWMFLHHVPAAMVMLLGGLAFVGMGRIPLPSGRD